MHFIQGLQSNIICYLLSIPWPNMVQGLFDALSFSEDFFIITHKLILLAPSFRIFFFTFTNQYYYLHPQFVQFTFSTDKWRFKWVESCERSRLTSNFKYCFRNAYKSPMRSLHQQKNLNLPRNFGSNKPKHVLILSIL